MKTATFNAETLSRALTRAKAAHSEYERTHGPDPNWPSWYARFIVEEYGSLNPAAGFVPVDVATMY